MGKYSSKVKRRYHEGNFDERYLKYVDNLIKDGFNLNVKSTNCDGNTLLHLSIKEASQFCYLPEHLNRHMRICSNLLTAGADPNTPNNKGWTPLKLAFEFYFNRILPYKNQSDNNDKFKCFYELLIRKGADINYINKLNGKSIVKYIIDTYTYISHTYRGLYMKYLERIKVLTDLGATFGMSEFATVLINIQFERDRSRNLEYNIRLLKWYLAEGIPITVDQKLENTPILTFLMCCYTKFRNYGGLYFDLFKIAINRGVDVDLKCDNEWTPLMYACKNDLNKFALVLIGVGADLNGALEKVGKSNHKLIKVLKKSEKRSKKVPDDDTNDEIIKIDLG